MVFTENKLIQSLTKCAIECEHCADACLDEKDKLQMLVECIRLDRDCGQLTRTTADFLARRSDMSNDLVAKCEDICRRCAEECEKHDTVHCRECAKACRECEEACKSYTHV